MFWDSSALVPCLVSEDRSPAMSALLGGDPSIVCWWSAPVECASALESRRRTPQNPLPEAQYQDACRRLSDLRLAVSFVEPTDQVRAKAMEYLRRYPLRAADALQLAAAFVARQPTFACLDQRLCNSAVAEGFVLLP